MQAGPCSKGNPPVGIGIENELRKGIGYLDGAVDPVLVGIVLARIHRNLQPKTLPVGALIHEVLGRRQKVVKIPQNINELLEWSAQHQTNRAVVEVVCPVEPTRRNRCHHLNWVTRVVERVVGRERTRAGLKHHRMLPRRRSDQIIVKSRCVGRRGL